MGHFHSETMQLKKIFEKNRYDNKLLNKIYSRNVPQYTDPKKDIKYQKKPVPYFVTSYSVIAAMLLTTINPNVTLRFVYLNIWESLHVQENILL